MHAGELPTARLAALAWRTQILAAAEEQFRAYGYTKTTIADVAAAVGISPTYVYRFFRSKREIGNAICARCLAPVAGRLVEIANAEIESGEKIIAFFGALAAHAAQTSLHEVRLRAMILRAWREGWPAVAQHDKALRTALLRILEEGRHSGAFERASALEDVFRGVLLLLEPFQNPRLWSLHPGRMPRRAALLGGLVARSLRFSQE